MSPSQLKSKPILTLTMDELVEGHERYSHNFKDLIDYKCDIFAAKNPEKTVKEYRVENVDGVFTVFVVFSENTDG